MSDPRSRTRRGEPRDVSGPIGPGVTRILRAGWRRLVSAVATLLILAGCASRKPEPWQAVPIPTDADFTGLWFADSLNGWMTGSGWAIDGGIVGRTRDGGRTWRFESGIVPGGGKGDGLGQVQFRDTLRGGVIAANGQILVTDDGGASWRPARVPGLGRGRLHGIQFVDEWNGWAAGTEILRTDDGGETWRLMIRGASENGYLSANAIDFLDPTHGWLVGPTGTVMRTDDGGSQWTEVRLPLREGEHPTLWDIRFTDPDHGWIVGEDGVLFRTEDGGAGWSRETNGVPIARLTRKGEPVRRRDVVPELETEADHLTLAAIRFADPQHGWAVGYYPDIAESVVLRSDDGGVSWVTERVQTGELLRSLFVLDARHAWAAGDRARRQPQVVLRYTGSLR